MPRINLLPWRAELRQKRKKEFMVALAAASSWPSAPSTCRS
jgi:Tfp pilus assembly protein PilN